MTFVCEKKKEKETAKLSRNQVLWQLFIGIHILGEKNYQKRKD